eukprot:UN12918
MSIEMDSQKNRNKTVICTICLKVKRSDKLKGHMKVHARTLKFKSNSSNMHLKVKKVIVVSKFEREQISSFENRKRVDE